MRLFYKILFILVVSIIAAFCFYGIEHFFHQLDQLAGK